MNINNSPIELNVNGKEGLKGIKANNKNLNIVSIKNNESINLE